MKTKYNPGDYVLVRMKVDNITIQNNNSIKYYVLHDNSINGLVVSEDEIEGLSQQTLLSTIMNNRMDKEDDEC